jgi:hypothetical protein
MDVNCCVQGNALTELRSCASRGLVTLNGLVVTWPNSRHLGQVVPVPKTGLRGDCDFVKRVSKAGHGNDRVWKAWKAMKPA